MVADTPEKGPRPEKAPHEMTARLRELMAIPERLRTDAEWDEIIEIEISQQQGRAPGNMGSKRTGPGPMRQSEGGGGGGGKPPHKNFRKGPMKRGRGPRE